MALEAAGSSPVIHPIKIRMNKKKVLIKIGGKLLEGKIDDIINKIVFLSKENNLVIVNGGGNKISELMSKLNKETRFIAGQRYTDLETLNLVEMALSWVNKKIVALFNLKGIKAVGISGKDGFLVEAKKISLKEDLGYIGEIEKVNPELIYLFWENNYLPVIYSVGMDKNGITYNINADFFAFGLGEGLKVDRLIFLTDVEGVLDKDKKTIPLIKEQQISDLIENNIISQGMIPKIQAARAALKNGIKEVDILNDSFKGTKIIL